LTSITLGSATNPLSVTGFFDVVDGFTLADGAVVNSTAEWRVRSPGLNTSLIHVVSPTTGAVFNMNGGALAADDGLGINPGVTFNIGNGSFEVGTFFNQSGVLNINAGGTLTMGLTAADTWQNSGTLTLNDGGTLNLGGTITVYDAASRLGNFVMSGDSTLNLTGRLDLAPDAAFALDIATGAMKSSPVSGTIPLLKGKVSGLSGTISGGSVYSSDPTHALNGNGGTLDHITLGYGSDLTLDAHGSFIVKGDMTLADGMTLNTDAVWRFADTSAWSHSSFGFQFSTVTQNIKALQADGITPGMAIINATGGAFSGHESYPYVVSPFPYNSQLDINAGITLNVQGGSFSFGSGFVDSFYPDRWVNPGVINLNAGTLNLAGNFTLAGLGVVGGGETAGSFNRSSGTTLNISGLLDLQGSGSVDIVSGGSFGVGGLGTVSGTLYDGRVFSSDPGHALVGDNALLDGIILA
jgi:hypothetical protein